MDCSNGTIAYLFGDFRLDAQQRVLMLKVDGRVLPLTARVIDTLLYFVQHRGELLDKGTLMMAIWPNVIVEENNLNQSISVLRRVLGDTRDEHRFIVTVPNRGYRFVADVTTETNPPSRPRETEGVGAIPVAIPECTPSSIANGASPHLPGPPPVSAHLHAGRVAAAAGGSVLFLMFGYILWNRAVPTARDKTHTQDNAQLVVAAPRTIAVLPFADMSPNHDQEYFADGLSEELSDRLSRVPGLRVIGRTSAFSFKGKHEDLRTIGKALGAGHLLEGSLRKEGDRLRITAQLVDSNGTGVWSNNYDQKLGDVFAIQDEVAKSVAAVLSVTLTERQNDVTRGGTRNTEAYEAYLAAKAIIRSGLPDDVRRGIALFEQAVALDPGFGRAWSELALIYAINGFPERNSEEWKAKVRQATSRALDTAPDTPRALAAAATVAMMRKDWAEAERRLKRAGDFSVGSDNVWEKTGWFLVTVGRPWEAAQYMRLAGFADPLFGFYPAAVGGMYEMSGELDQSAVELAKSARLFASSGFAAFNGLLLAMARHDRAPVEKAMSGWPADAFDDSMRSRLGEPQAALAELRRVAADPRSPKNTWARAVLAYWAAYFGDPEFALRMMHDVLADPSMAWVLWRQVLKDMRQLPGFKDLVRDLGLVDYWRTSGNWSEFCRPLSEDDFECS